MWECVRLPPCLSAWLHWRLFSSRIDHTAPPLCSAAHLNRGAVTQPLCFCTLPSSTSQACAFQMTCPDLWMTGWTFQLTDIIIIGQLESRFVRQTFLKSCLTSLFLIISTMTFKNNLIMHFSNGLAAVWVESTMTYIQYKHSIHPTGYTDTQYVHWHELMRSARPSAVQVHSSTDSHCKPNRSAKMHDDLMRDYKNKKPKKTP